MGSLGDSLTAFLLFINDVIPEDQTLDQQSLPKAGCRSATTTRRCLIGSRGPRGFKATHTRRSSED